LIKPSDGPPLITIGMPLYNAESHLAEALDSLLAQDYPNLEVVISDNASSDATESICRTYAARDTRISYQRSERNLGAVWNFNRVFELGRGKYFMWAAHDDVRAPQYISRCTAELEADPQAVLCCTGIRLIDDEGQTVEPWIDVIRPVGPTVGARVKQIARARFWWDVYGLARSSVLAQTRRAQPVWGFDVVVTMELCLRGPVLLVPEPLFLYRADPKRTTQHVATSLGTSEGPGPIPVNWSAMALELARSIWLAPLGAARRLGLITLLMVQFCVFNGLAGSGMTKDVLPSTAAAWRERRFGRVAALLGIAVLVFPVHNGVVRGAYRLLRRPSPKRRAPV
jgi:hypothetical protein